MKLPLDNRGVTLIEVIIAVSVVAIMLVTVGFSVIAYVEARSQLLSNAKSLYLVEEGYEMARLMRDINWDDIDTLDMDDTHYFDVSTTSITISASQEVIDGEYYRSFVLTDVYRDGSDDITASTTPGATVDSDVRYVTVSVFGPTGTTSLTGLLTNINAQ